MCTDASLEVEKVNFALERERKLADMQFIQSDLRREIEAL
jgi:hypothetical protein